MAARYIVIDIYKDVSAVYMYTYICMYVKKKNIYIYIARAPVQKMEHVCRTVEGMAAVYMNIYIPTYI